MTDKELGKAVAAVLSEKEIENADKIRNVLSHAVIFRRHIEHAREMADEFDHRAADYTEKLNTCKRRLYVLGWTGPHKGEPE